MTHFDRKLDLSQASQRKSLFLFSPRQTGKTTLLKKRFPEAPFYNLLLSDVFLKLSQRPQRIREELLAQNTPTSTPIIIDEIQKLPVLLDEVHHLIEEHGYHFILTGSSPRSLKKGSANLLGGRARTFHLHPLVSAEIPEFDMMRVLNFGALPPIYNSCEPSEDLEDYVGSYLKEEIQAEGATRHIENFSRFLQVASLHNTQVINFENIANDSQVPPRTIIEYFAILQDTLVGTLLEPFKKTKKRKAITSAKFYFFDVGVANILAGNFKITKGSTLFGTVFEHFIFTEIQAYLSYSRDKRALSFWRTHGGYEVDFVIGDNVAIEVKGSHTVTEKHLKSMKAFSSEIKPKQKLVVSLEDKARKIDDVLILPVNDFLTRLWGGEL